MKAKPPTIDAFENVPQAMPEGVDFGIELPSIVEKVRLRGGATIDLCKPCSERIAQALREEKWQWPNTSR